MKRPENETLAAVLPYVVWMALLFALPATAGSYAVRVAAAAVALLWWGRTPFGPLRWAGLGSLLPGLLVGVAVGVLWIVPEQWAWYRETSLMKLVGLAPATAAEETEVPARAEMVLPVRVVLVAGAERST